MVLYHTVFGALCFDSVSIDFSDTLRLLGNKIPWLKVFTSLEGTSLDKYRLANLQKNLTMVTQAPLLLLDEILMRMWTFLPHPHRQGKKVIIK